jgi:outer membrane protein assembly factor BamB
MNEKLRRTLAVIGCALLAVALTTAASHAISTRQFVLDSATVLSEGKLEGTAVLSSGAVVPSVGTRRLGLENVAVARSLLVRPDGSAYVGTGNDGKIWKLTGDKASVFCETGEMLVTSMLMAPDGTLYAGTLPKAKVFAIDKQGKAKLFVQPKDAEHVWALAYDDKKKTLFVATGPKGELFAVDAQGKADVLYRSATTHIMSLSRASDGRLYAGTSDDALLVRVEGPSRAEVVYDFEGNEVTALSVLDGRVAVAANQFQKPAGSIPVRPALERPAVRLSVRPDRHDPDTVPL